MAVPQKRLFDKPESTFREEALRVLEEAWQLLHIDCTYRICKTCPLSLDVEVGDYTCLAMIVSDQARKKKTAEVKT